MAGGAKGNDPKQAEVNAAIDAAGGFGRFQMITLLAVILCMVSGGFITHGIAYLELVPHEPGYICTNKVTGNEEKCDPDFFCDQKDVYDYRVDFDAEKENLYNWYTKLDLCCLEKKYTGYIGIAASASIFAACLFVPRLGDLYGRKPVFLVAVFVQAPILTWLAFTESVT